MDLGSHWELPKEQVIERLREVQVLAYQEAQALAVQDLQGVDEYHTHLSISNEALRELRIYLVFQCLRHEVRSAVVAQIHQFRLEGELYFLRKKGEERDLYRVSGVVENLALSLNQLVVEDRSFVDEGISAISIESHFKGTQNLALQAMLVRFASLVET